MVDEAAFTKNDQMQGILGALHRADYANPKKVMLGSSQPQTGGPKELLLGGRATIQNQSLKNSHAPTNSNPLVSQDEFDRIKLENLRSCSPKSTSRNGFLGLEPDSSRSRNAFVVVRA